MKLIVVLVATGAALLAGAVPALAGGWAVTFLDPLPERIEAGHGYTAGYWVLQHGSHPSQIPLGNTGLKFVDETGQILIFQGVALAEPAHYATAFLLPHDGTWKLYGLQGVFREYEVGSLTVPGSLMALPAPAPLEITGHDDHAWGAIHPPPITSAHSHSAGADPSATTRSQSSGGAAKTPPAGFPLPPAPVLAAVAVAGIAAAFALLRAPIRRLVLGRRSRTVAR